MGFVELMEAWLVAETIVDTTEPILKEAKSAAMAVGKKIFDDLQKRIGEPRDNFRFLYQERPYIVNSRGEISEGAPVMLKLDRGFRNAMLPVLEQLDGSGVEKEESA